MSEQPARVKTPFADDLLFSRMEGVEELGRLYQYELEFLSPKEDLALDDLLGKDLTVEMDVPNGSTRYFHGYVTQFSHTGRRGRYVTYTAIVHPWLWFLTRTSDCRIFQEKTIPDIIKEVFRDLGFTDFKDALSEEYRKWEYCVQYRETDFNFISRLMEQEGIYYYFEQEAGKHTLVLADAYGAHAPLPKYEEIPYRSPAEPWREEHIYEWNLSKSVQTGACTIGAFHFMKPKADLVVQSSIVHPHDHEDFEIFDYPGEHYERGEGDRYVGVRMQELACEYERVQGEADARGIFPGGLFNLVEYPRDDQNREYLVVSAQHSLAAIDYESGDTGDFKYNCSFEAIESKAPFRATRITPKPVVQGPQTAIVVGKSGEEIWTDEYGRVKVQFHWDRYGKKDENSSCWVRVAQVWAGGQWGGMTVPRMGQEVIVDFIEGDPDRPIITGRVYNADNMPPYKLPDDKTKSTLKSHSTKGGGADNFNEIRFEDKKGEEELFIQAEKDEKINVKNDKSETVGANETISIGNDRKETVQGNETITVAKDREETVQGNEKLTVVMDRERNVTGSETINVAKTRTHNVTINESINIGAAQEIVVGGFQAIEVGGIQSFDVGANQSMGIGRNQDVDVGKNRTVSVGQDDDLKVEKKLVIDVGDEVTLKCGKSSITMKKDGTVTIDGKDLTLKASGKIGVKASKDVKIKGSKVQAN